MDISGYGLKVHLLASVTFPVGIFLTQFADDTDPFDLPTMQIADKSMGLNGDLLVWSKPNPIILSLSVVPDSEDDNNLNILFEANRVAKGKSGSRDDITVTGLYPNGGKVILLNGRITDGMPGNPVSSAGRLKTKTYQFAFENTVNARIL